MRELRRAPRVPIRTMLITSVDGNRLVRGNLSLSGVGFEMTSPCHLHVGEPIDVAVFLPEQTVHLRAMVKRIRHAEPRSVGRSFVGAELLEVDELVANPLYRFVEESLLLGRPVAEAEPLNATI